ncbi:hypothetical protein HDU96_004923 [Phlyctochytrium bullatum]|nr:hypothetical protein HDU96_004923 [Phlyctochytrium bullatum]
MVEPIAAEEGAEDFGSLLRSGSWRYHPISLLQSHTTTPSLVIRGTDSTLPNPNSVMVNSAMRNVGIRCATSDLFFGEEEKEAARLECLALSAEDEKMLDYYLLKEGPPDRLGGPEHVTEVYNVAA